MNIKNVLWIVFVLLSKVILSQTTISEIRLLDLETTLPIVQATYEYGAQTGISDKNGIISFDYTPGTNMQLSHINYGIWQISDTEIEKLIKSYVYYRAPLTQHLYPVTVIALKPQKTQPGEAYKIEYPDRLEHDAADILNQTPAFHSIRKGGNYGFEPVFRGFKYDQLNIVMNGAQSATAACPNRMDPPTSQMAPNMMDRIEILKGPHALRFGTGLGATINFIPARLKFNSLSGLSGRLSSGYENNGQVIRGESQIGFNGKNHDISVFASWSQGDDYKTGNGEIVQADFTRGSFGSNMGFKLASNQQLRVSAIYNRARDADFPALAMDLREDDTWMFSMRHDIQFNKGHLQLINTTAYGSFVNHLMDNLLKPLDPRMMNAENLATTYNYGGRTESVWQFGKNKLFAGADIRIEGAEGTRVREFLLGPMAGKIIEENAWQNGRINKTGLFAEYLIKGSVFDYALSGRLEMNNSTLQEPTPEFTQVYPDFDITQINPGLSAGIMRDLGSSIQTGLWLARVQRSGSLTERFINYFTVGQDPYEMLGNPQLLPEVNNQADLTVKWNIGAGSVINADLYMAYLQNYISSVIDTTLTPRLPTSPGVRQFVNIDEAYKTGLEVTWDQRLYDGLSQRLGIAYTYGQDLERDEPLPEIAPLDIRYTLMGSFFTDRLKPEISVQYSAEQSRISNEFGETVTASFLLIDIKVSFKATSNLTVNAGIHNLLDEQYYEHLNRSVRGSTNPIFAPGQNLFANVNFTF